MSTVLEAVPAAIADQLRTLEETIENAREAIERQKCDALNQLEPWLDKRGAAKYLAMSISTLEKRLASRNAPPHTHDGGKLRFKPSELDAWLRQWTAHPRMRGRRRSASRSPEITVL
jgi:excisionase family DNA binding protein